MEVWSDEHCKKHVNECARAYTHTHSYAHKPACTHAAQVLATDMKQHFAIVSHFTTIHRLSTGDSLTPSAPSARGLALCRCVCACVHAHAILGVCVCACSFWQLARARAVCVCVCVSVHMCMHACGGVCVCVRAWARTCLCAGPVMGCVLWVSSRAPVYVLCKRGRCKRPSARGVPSHAEGGQHASGRAPVSVCASHTGGQRAATLLQAIIA